METVTRYEVQRETAPDRWETLGRLGSLAFREGPVYFGTSREAERELRFSARAVAPHRLRVVEVADVVTIEPLDLEEFALPLVVRFLRLRGAKHRNGRLEPLLDARRATVGRDLATLSPWEHQEIVFAPEIPLGRLRERFPFARPETVEDVVRLLTLHELAHVAFAHAPLAANGRPESAERRARCDAMEREADALTALWWREGLTPATVTTEAALSARAAA